MMHDMWNNNVVAPSTNTNIRPCKSAPCSPIKPIGKPQMDTFHVAYKVPVGDTPYVKAKRVQLVDKDPEKAIALFWAAINAGDRVDSALKDMAIVMKQQNRAEEAIEAIKSLRRRCSEQAQESLDNILLDLYKRCGRLDDQIGLLRHKLQLIQQGLAFNGKRTKTARSQGRKFQVSIEQEATRLLGNLGWALMQTENYVEAEAAYRKALLIGPDNNKMCNLGICLMKQGRIMEAKETLRQVRPAVIDNIRGADSHLKAYERAQEMLGDIEYRLLHKTGQENWLFEAFVGGSSSIWKPEPCIEYSMMPPRDNFADENWNGLNVMSNNRTMAMLPPSCNFADENVNGLNLTSNNRTKAMLPPSNNFADENVNGLNSMINRSKAEMLLPSNSLNIAAPPFYSTRLMKEQNGIISHQLHDPLGRVMKEQNGCSIVDNLKRTRSGNAVMEKVVLQPNIEAIVSRRNSLSGEDTGDKWPELPDNNAFNEAIVAAVLAPVLEDNKNKNNIVPKTTNINIDTANKSPALCEGKGKRLRIFQDITQALDSPKQKLVYNI